MNKRNKICPFCISLISNRSHLKKCKPEIDLKDSYILMIEKNYNINIKDLTIDYSENFYSLPDIKQKYNLPYKTTMELLKLSNVNIRSLSEASLLDKRNDKIRKTSLEKYGVDNISKLDSIKDKKKETFLKNYGEDNVFKTKEFKEYLDILMMEKYGKLRVTNPHKISESRKNFSLEKWNDINQKIEKTSLIRYGVTNVSKMESRKKEFSEFMKSWWKSLSDIEKEKLINRNFNLVSNLEIKVRDILDSNTILYTPQRFINGLSYDFLINKTNIIIEVQGDYWHANPIKYKMGDLIKYPGIGILEISKVWEKDRIKRENAEFYGYKILYLWESEINKAEKNGNLEFFILEKIYGISKD